MSLHRYARPRLDNRSAIRDIARERRHDMTLVSDGLDVQQVSKRWRRSSRPVLDAASVRVAPGELARITGENGAGKTTLARIVAGLVLPDSGTVSLQGADTVAHQRRFHRQLGFVSAGDRALYARLSVRDHLSAWSRLAMLPADERDEAIAVAMDDFALGEILRSRVDRISMGQRQRLRLALAFLHRPALALLDEPTTSLDEHGRELLTGAVLALLARGGIVVWISPEAELTELPAAHELVLRDGELSPR
jgi:ABC-type multidrug transport system ATPase subunit